MSSLLFPSHFTSGAKPLSENLEYPPGGKPDMLFHVPSSMRIFFSLTNSGYTCQGIEVDSEDLEIADNILSIDSHPTYINKDLHDLLLCYLKIHGVIPANDADTGLEMYVKLLRILESDNFII